jgi:membrane-associated phospholipid phosphatase
MLLIAVLLVASAAAATAAWAGGRALQRPPRRRLADAAAETAMRARPRLRAFVRSRLDAEVATGLGLTLALAAIVVAGLVVGLLAVAVTHVELLADIDSSAARWAHRDGGPRTRDVLDAVTTLATTPVVLALGVVVGLRELVRLPNRSIPAFLLLVTLGDSLITNVVKQIVGRARPDITPAAASLGPSFPSGHSSTAAAFYAALALLAARGRPGGVRALLAAAAVGIAVAVACSRVMLDLHWLSDVVAGLALGWGWFAACAIAFGGRLLRFGEPVEEAAGLRPGTLRGVGSRIRPRARSSAPRAPGRG